MSRRSLENKSDSWETRIKRNVDVETSHFDPQQTFLKAMKKTEKVNRTQERQNIKSEKDSHIIWTEISKSHQDKTYMRYLEPRSAPLFSSWWGYFENVWWRHKVRSKWRLEPICLPFSFNITKELYNK